MLISKLLLGMLNPNDQLHLPKNQVRFSRIILIRVQGCPDLRPLIGPVPSIAYRPLYQLGPNLLHGTGFWYRYWFASRSGHVGSSQTPWKFSKFTWTGIKTFESQFGTAEMESRLRDYYEKQSTFNSFQGKGGRIDGKKKGTKGKLSTRSFWVILTGKR